MNAQNHNRYSYCLNSPLKFTDPSGYSLSMSESLGKREYEGFFYDYTINDRMEWLHSGGGGGGNNCNYFMGPGYTNWVEGGTAEGFTTSDPTIEEQLEAWFGPAIPPNPEEEGQSNGPIVVDNTAQALSHYLFGDGSAVRIGPETVKALLNHPDFLEGHRQVMRDELNKPYFNVDMTWSVFHVGDTRVSYSIDEANRNVTYTLFDGDSFSDADFVDEYVMWNLFGEPAFKSDGLGPNLERFWGTPYNYIPVSIIFSY